MFQDDLLSLRGDLREGEVVCVDGLRDGLGNGLGDRVGNRLGDGFEDIARGGEEVVKVPYFVDRAPLLKETGLN